MKNRDKWITIAFLIFILVIPLVTVARNMLPKQQGEELTEAERAVLVDRAGKKAAAGK